MTTPTMLLVTPDETRRRTLTDAFASAGFQVAHTAAVHDVATVHDGPTVLVIDADLPDLQGFALCRGLRAYPATAHLLVGVVCPAGAPGDVRAAAFASGADAVFTEPLDAPLVAANVQALLRLKAAERAACRCVPTEEWMEAEALKAVERRLGALAEVVEDLFWINEVNPPRCLYVSPSYERRWGLSRQALYDDIGAWDRMVHPEDVARVLRAFVTKAAAGGFDEEYRIVLPDGRVRWVRERAFPLVDDDGQVRRVAGITEDVTERRAMRGTLEATEIWLELAQHGARAGAWEWIVATNEVRWSPACYDMYGLPRDTPLSYETWASRLHPEDQARATGIVARAMDTGDDLSIEFRIVRPDGEVRWASAVARIVRDATNRATRLVGFTLDVTARKGAEEMRQFLLALQDRFSRPVGPERIAREVTAALGEHLGVVRCLVAELEGDDALVVHPDFHRNGASLAGARQLAFLGSDVLAAVRAGQVVILDDAHGDPGGAGTIGKDATGTADVGAMIVAPIVRGEQCTAAVVVISEVPRRWREDEVALIRTVAGRVGLALENARLLDGLRAAVAARDAALVGLERSEARLRRIVEACPVGILVGDAGRISEANAAFLALVGFTAEDLRRGGLDWRSMTPAEYAPLDERAIAELRKSGECAPYEKEYVRKDGSRVPVLIGAAVLHTDPPEGVCFVVDMTGQRRARELTEAARRVAEEASGAKDQFLAMLSHELRTPLAAVVGWTRLLRDGGLDADRTARALASIERATQSQLRLIDDLLDVSRIVAGKLVLERDRIDFVQVVDHAAATVRDAVAARRQQLRLDLPREALAVDGDARRLEQVVWNLLGNAVKFTPEGGRIHIRLERSGAVARLSVSDTGKGIARSFLPHVFDRFWQAGEGRGRVSRGLGLGLAIAKHVVEAHGGRITGESAGEGRGSTFTVELPVVGSQVRRDASPGERRVSRRLESIDVLVVDDDEETCVLVKTILEQYGARVRTAASSKAARVAIDDRMPRVLICDIEMPGEDGYALIADVHRRPLATPLPALALTAHVCDADRQSVLAAGFQEHLGKPFDPEALVATVMGLIEGHSPPVA